MTPRGLHKIDAGVPMPRRNVHSATWKKMRVGDSVHFITQSEAAAFYQATWQGAKGTKYESVMRKVDDGWRVWKAKRESA